MAFSVRTIFLMVRGSYQAGLAMRMARTDLRELNKEQQRLIRQSEEAMRAANQWIFAGAAFMAFGLMAWRGISQAMEASYKGRRVMFQFGRQMQTIMHDMSEAMAPMVEQILGVVTSILGWITAVPIVRDLVAGILVFGTVLLIVSGVILLVKGAVATLKLSLGGLTARLTGASIATTKLGSVQSMLTPSMLGYKAAVDITTPSIYSLGGAFTMLKVAMGPIVLALGLAVGLFAGLRGTFGPVIAGVIAMSAAVLVAATAMWALAIPLNIVTLGGAALAALGGIVATQALIPEFKYGTSFVSKGGMAIVHGGEEIISARETRFISKIERERTIERTTGGRRTVMNISIPIGTIHTKADKEELVPFISRAMRKALNQKY